MSELFGELSRAVQGSWPLALGAALVWGVLSIVLSPCHLASIPLVVGFIGGQGEITLRRATLLATLFASGILASIAAIGLISATAGRMLGDVGPWTYAIVAVVFLIVGLQLLDALPLPGFTGSLLRTRRRGAPAALLLGLVFGVALGPCTFAFMAPMLAVVFAVGTTDLAFGSALLLAYGIGHSAVIVLAGSSVERVQRALNWNERSRGLVILRRVCGALVILAGLYLLSLAR